ncbi:hypothetical protein [Paenibacillus sp. WLX2291]|uniref:hypothetical protein n=1 Tax=Paenibacillus sp. WLX2291 TaxID=3296934 RepID=UPI003983FB1E
MIKLLVGCTLILASIMLLCTGFILAGLEGAAISSQVNGGAFTYQILHVGLGWIVIPVILLLAGVGLVYSSRHHFDS